MKSPNLKSPNGFGIWRLNTVPAKRRTVRKAASEKCRIEKMTPSFSRSVSTRRHTKNPLPFLARGVALLCYSLIPVILPANSNCGNILALDIVKPRGTLGITDK